MAEFEDVLSPKTQTSVQGGIAIFKYVFFVKYKFKYFYILIGDMARDLPSRNIYLENGTRWYKNERLHKPLCDPIG